MMTDETITQKILPLWEKWKERPCTDDGCDNVGILMRLIYRAAFLAGLEAAKGKCVEQSNMIIASLMTEIMATDRRNRIVEQGCGVNLAVEKIDQLIKEAK